MYKNFLVSKEVFFVITRGLFYLIGLIKPCYLLL